MVNTDLKRLYKCPKEDADGVALAEQFDEAGGSKQSQKSDIDEIFLHQVIGHGWVVVFWSNVSIWIESEREILTPNSTTSASIILPTTVTKSNVFQGSLKKFFWRPIDNQNQVIRHCRYDWNGKKRLVFFFALFSVGDSEEEGEIENWGFEDIEEGLFGEEGNRWGLVIK